MKKLFSIPLIVLLMGGLMLASCTKQSPKPVPSKAPAPEPTSAPSVERNHDLAKLLRAVVDARDGDVDLGSLSKAYDPVTTYKVVTLLKKTQETQPSLVSALIESASSGTDPTLQIASLLGTDDRALLAPLLDYAMDDVYVTFKVGNKVELRPFRDLRKDYDRVKRERGFGVKDVEATEETEKYVSYYVARHVADLVAPGTGELVGWVVSNDPDLRHLVFQGSVDVAYEGGKLALRTAQVAGEKIALIQTMDKKQVYLLVTEEVRKEITSVGGSATFQESLVRARQASQKSKKAAKDVAQTVSEQWADLKPILEKKMGKSLGALETQAKQELENMRKRSEQQIKRAEEKLKDAGKKAEEKLKDAGKKTEEKLKDAGKKAEEKLKDAGKKTEQKVKDWIGGKNKKK